MSLLTLCQDVADVIGLTRPTAIINGTDQLSRQMLALSKVTLDELIKMDWPVLQVAYTFNTVSAQAQYSLPADFVREVGDTVYASARYAELRGSLTPADWARQRNELPAVGRFRFRIYGYPLKLIITPTPTTVESIVLEYETSGRVAPAGGGALQTTYAADDDVSVVPEELVKKGLTWRLRRAKGLDYSEEFDDYEVSRAQMLAQQLGLGSMPIAYRSPFDMPGLGTPYVPENGFG